MNISKTPHEWSKDTLLNKAERYIEEMLASDASQWQFGFWSAMALEFLIKASLANISPVLVADGSDWSNLLYALGNQPNQKKFQPRSADISVLLVSLEKAFPDFTKEMLEICAAHLNRRNAEVHSGALPFDKLGTGTWLPGYYLVSQFLLNQMGESLADLFGEEAAEEGEVYIQAFQDEAAKAVKQNINAHKTIWLELKDEERTEKQAQAKNVALRFFGHRVDCPACESAALLLGSPAGTPSKKVENGEIIEKQRMLPTELECVACGLRISGYSKLLAGGFGDAFIATHAYSPIEYFDIDIVDEYRSMMDEDNNEPY